jgi:hypothetical protein
MMDQSEMVKSQRAADVLDNLEKTIIGIDIAEVFDNLSGKGEIGHRGSLENSPRDAPK